MLVSSTAAAVSIEKEANCIPVICNLYYAGKKNPPCVQWGFPSEEEYTEEYLLCTP